VWFAGIAGVLLYLSGIISGYFDNLVVFADIKKRIQLHRGLKNWFGKSGAENIAAYIDKNLGAIMGNVLLGFGLGFMIFFGKILGVPLDIRHVTISSGFFGFSWFASGFSFDTATLLACGIGLAMIATTNLLVSFTLALFTAMKSRGLRTRQLLPLIKLTGRYFLHFPSHFVYPPKYAGAQA
jgi:site-specific recombinase